MSALVLATSLAATSAGNSTVMLSGRDITVADVAILAPGERGSLASMVIATLPRSASSVELGAQQRASLVRHRIPGIPLRLLDEGAVRFEAGRPARSEAEVGRAGRACFALRQNLLPGDYLTGPMVEHSPCQSAQSRLSLVYDPDAGTARATAEIPAGTYLGQMGPLPEEVVAPGSRLRLVVIEGPVRIERDVEALQPALQGKRLFVRSADGKTFSAPAAIDNGGSAHP